MFDLLKKKLNSFAEQVKEKIKKKEEKPAGEKKAEAVAKPAAEKPKKPAGERPKAEKPAAQMPRTEKPAARGPAAERPEKIETPAAQVAVEKPAEPAGEIPVEAERPAEPEELALREEALEEPAKPVEEKRQLKPRVGIRGRLKAVVKGAVELERKDIAGLLWELELALLEADVEQTTAEEICKSIGESLVGKRVSRKADLGQFVKKEVEKILTQMMQTEQRDIIKEVREKRNKPYKILFLGPNGAGKTTTIAKLSALIQQKGLRVVWAAADTFRAASIEQLEKHAKKLGIRVVKHQYGADPAAVAFDAVKSAQAKGIECVMIDSAGRQETNRNLMAELQKIVRVIQPDLKVYVGEAFTGQALLQQAKEFDKALGIDGFVLTKVDCDSKGGTTISLLYKLQKPILFVGTGQEYKDLQRFKPDFVLRRVIG